MPDHRLYTTPASPDSPSSNGNAATPDDATLAVWHACGERCVFCNANQQLVRDRGEALTTRLVHVHLLPACSGCDRHADVMFAMSARREPLGARR